MSPDTALHSDPDAFFRDHSGAPSLKGPTAVVTAIALVSAVSAALQFQVTAQLFADSPGGSIVQVVQAISLVVALVVPYVIWMLYAGVFHAISVVFDGTGEFTRTLALVGWGFVPSLFGSVVAAVIDFYRFNVQGVDVPAEITQESMQQFQQQIQSGPLVAMAAALGILFTLWSGMLWTFAMKHARELTLRQAALTVVLPVLVSLAFSGWSLVNAL